MSRGQHQQENNHHKYGTRGERKLAKLGIRIRTVGLRRLSKELGVKKPTP